MAATKCGRCAGQGMLPCPPPWVPPNAGEWSSDGFYFRSCPDCNGSGALVSRGAVLVLPIYPMLPVAPFRAPSTTGVAAW